MNKKNQLDERLSELASVVDADHEVQMARGELYKIAKYAIKLHEMLKNVSEAEGIEAWQQSKITKAADYIGSVYHALEYDQKVMTPIAAEGKKSKNRMSESAANEYKELLEKAKSKAQQKFMGMVYATKKGDKPASKAVAKAAKGMSKTDAKDYASTKHKGKPEHVKEADDDSTAVMPTVKGRTAFTPYQAKMWKDDAEQKSERALKAFPDFFNDDHMRRVEEIYALLNDTLKPQTIYVNHRSGTRATGPFSVVKAVYPTWPKELRQSSSARQRVFHDPIKQLGGIVKNLESSPGIMVHVFNSNRE
jgi:hypothetical protein